LQVDGVNDKFLMSLGPNGVKGFWYYAMRNHPQLNKIVSDKDKEALMHLTDIQSKLHENGFGFDLIFNFSHNPYFKDNIVTKKYIIPK
jgi:nucleosome assembly protein 1-like 1